MSPKQAVLDTGEHLKSLNVQRLMEGPIMYVLLGCLSPTQRPVRTHSRAQHLASLRAGALAALFIVVDLALRLQANPALNARRQPFGFAGQGDQACQSVHARQSRAFYTSAVIPISGERA